MEISGKAFTDRTKGTPSARSISRPVDSFNMVLSSRAETESFGRAIGRLLKGGEVLALIGTLGAGKTALVRGIAAGLGVPSHAVSSPTFVLAHEYQGRVPLIHIDLYRITHCFEPEDSGLSDCLTDQTVAAIEWADRFPAWLPADRLEIRLMHRNPHTRDLAISALGPVSSLLLGRITQRRRRPSRTLTRNKGVRPKKASEQ